MTSGAPGPACVVGAYAMAPADQKELLELLTVLIRLPGVTGFELPLGWLSDVRAESLVRDQPGGGRHVLTLIGAQAAEAMHDPHFGLASTDPAGRRRAVELTRTAHREVISLSERGIRIVAVEIHSWPSVEPTHAGEGATALAESFAEIAEWSWGGTALILEHCDARSNDHPWQKGLLPLAAEIAAVETVRAMTPSTQIGMSVNWGRSAIEGRDPSLPVRHVRQLRARGLLDGVVFSGAAATHGAYGAPWSDVHLPMHHDQPESLMDVGSVADTMAAGSASRFLGIKVAAQPGDSVSRRVELIRHVLDAMHGTAPSLSSSHH